METLPLVMPSPPILSMVLRVRSVPPSTSNDPHLLLLILMVCAGGFRNSRQQTTVVYSSMGAHLQIGGRGTLAVPPHTFSEQRALTAVRLESQCRKSRMPGPSRGPQQTEIRTPE